ncbi:hypothetical protein TRIATDRAFT_302832 [Trichoderma atroviride IMI 206040]|uniref:Uncharacterized protein n=1 Tax=Hypocrea atroviridis (strain ATCC 20476 / IMI 206040) TaxID=452589 RepID=G9PC13_HYPAI|nr:uncharacterized protein TRIATDRAFT_302832 [Trichoderma atroviride IMI 206040]EHK39395.1 hypothetical protein TRIATDRAFT_302832 [Trichoderma atroviride IMI 206040]
MKASLETIVACFRNTCNNSRGVRLSKAQIERGTYRVPSAASIPQRHLAITD